jgi:hypothetical protein
MGIFLQAYGLKVDDTTHKNSATVEVEIMQGDKSIAKTSQTSDELKENGEQITIEKVLPAGALMPGKYKVQVRVTDTLANKTLERCGGGPCSAEFTVTEPPATKTAASTPASGR